MTTDKQALGENLLKNMKAVVKHLQASKMKSSSSMFLLGSYVTYIDFILFELCELVQFLTDGCLFTENPILERYC